MLVMEHVAGLISVGLHKQLILLSDAGTGIRYTGIEEQEQSLIAASAEGIVPQRKDGYVIFELFVHDLRDLFAFDLDGVEHQKDSVSKLYGL